MDLHPRNIHQGKYDIEALLKSSPSLKTYVFTNKYGTETINFSNQSAVKALNQALLKLYYDIPKWDIPQGYLIPPIPGRADYVHNIADLVGKEKGSETRIMDIGTGASLIYPIVGNRLYNWTFIAVETDETALENSEKIAKENTSLKNIELRHQKNPKSIFLGAIKSNEYVDATICNPPFHASIEDARKGTLRKLRNLNKGKSLKKAELNFGGRINELVTEGGEKQFIMNMIKQSVRYAENVGWFTTLVSKESLIPALTSSLRAKKAKFRVVEMGQGNKKSRILCWRFEKDNYNQKTQ